MPLGLRSQVDAVVHASQDIGPEVIQALRFVFQVEGQLDIGRRYVLLHVDQFGIPVPVFKETVFDISFAEGQRRNEGLAGPEL